MKKTVDRIEIKKPGVCHPPQRRNLKPDQQNPGGRPRSATVCIYGREVCSASKNKSQIRWTCSVCRGKGQRYHKQEKPGPKKSDTTYTEGTESEAGIEDE